MASYDVASNIVIRPCHVLQGGHWRHCRHNHGLHHGRMHRYHYGKAWLMLLATS
jgi:hypothetical protein